MLKTGTAAPPVWKCSPSPPGETYMIRNGKIAEMVRPVMLTGNVFTTLMNIDAIGNDLDMNEGGGCGKGGQSPLAGL